MADAPYMKLPADEGEAEYASAVPVADGRDPSGHRVGAWEIGFFGCFKDLVPNCLMVTVLPCISMAQISHRMRIARFSAVLLWIIAGQILTMCLNAVADPKPIVMRVGFRDDGYDPEAEGLLHDGNDPEPEPMTRLQIIAAVVSGLYSLAVVLFTWHLRSKIRHRFQIPGGPIKDCLAVSFCSCCALAQMATHVQSYEPGTCDFGPPDVLPAYPQ